MKQTKEEKTSKIKVCGGDGAGGLGRGVTTAKLDWISKFKMQQTEEEKKQARLKYVGAVGGGHCKRTGLDL